MRLAAALVVLLAGSASAAGSPSFGFRLAPTAHYLITPATDLKMARLSMPALLFPAIQDPATGEAARAAFEAMTLKAMWDNHGGSLFAFRRDEHVALVPDVAWADGAVALAKIDALDKPRHALMPKHELYEVQALLVAGDIGSAAERLREFFDRGPRPRISEGGLPSNW